MNKKMDAKNRENESNPLLDCTIPTDFNAFGIALTKNKIGICNMKYRTKKSTKD